MSDANRLTRDADGVYAFPHCDSAGCVYERRRENTHADDPDAPYYCEGCKSAVDEPKRREAYSTGEAGAPHAGAKYANLTPEDVGL